MSHVTLPDDSKDRQKNSFADFFLLNCIRLQAFIKYQKHKFIHQRTCRRQFFLIMQNSFLKVAKIIWPDRGRDTMVVLVSGYHTHVLLKPGRDVTTTDSELHPVPLRPDSE